MQRTRRAAYLAILFALTACGSGGSGNATPTALAGYGWTGSRPAEATTMSSAAFLAAVEAGSLRLLHEDEASRDLEALAAQREEARLRAESLFAGRTDILARHTGNRPDLADPKFRALGDGTWFFPLEEDRDPTDDEDPRGVILHGDAYTYGELAYVDELFKSIDNQRAVYGALFEKLDPALIGRLGLPDPSLISSYDYAQVLDLVTTVSGQWADLGGILAPPAGYPTIWSDEEGSASPRGDSATLTSATGPAALPIYPLRWCLTSIKSQGKRGTCTAFAIAAAVEALIADTQGRWVNLSEQMLYAHAKATWFPSTYGDGLYAGSTLTAMLTSGFPLPFEMQWDYNPSRFRVDYGTGYALSCQASDTGATYQEGPCSDTTHQAQVGCAIINGTLYCGVLVPPTGSGFRISGFQAIYDPGVVGLTTAKAFLALKRPVLVSVTVPTVSMDRDLLATTGGYVPYLGGAEGGVGTHTMCLVGYVTNAQLPAGAPPGDGGGYFICKNSWGEDYADGGFVYLPDDWMLTWAFALYVLNDTIVGP